MTLLDFSWPHDDDEEPLTAKGMLSDALWLLIAALAIPAGYVLTLLGSAAIADWLFPR